MKNIIISDDFMDPVLAQGYDGSRKFQILSALTGLPVDQVNFLIGQLFALFIAYYFRVWLQAGKTSNFTRHFTALSAGTMISYFCFGKQILLAIFLMFMCYCVLTMLPSNIFHHATLILSIVYLAIVHMYYQYTFDGKFVIDVTGPLMIIVQKVTSLAYSLHDGLYKEESKLTEMQKKYRIKTTPSLLEYLSYLMCFQSVLVGPYFMFTEYQDFIDGTHTIKWAAAHKKLQSSVISQEAVNNNYCSAEKNGVSKDKPSATLNTTEVSSRELENFLKEGEMGLNPYKWVFTKLAACIVCSISTIVILPRVSIDYLKEDEFLSASFSYKVFYILIVTSLARHLYYTAWSFADATCALSGLGFNGFDENGSSRWDLVTNVKIWKMESGLNLKETIENWNIGTMKWLRFLVYERANYQKTLLVYVLSSIWHGFYPGYYVTFIGGALFTEVARLVRRNVRPLVLQYGKRVKLLYDVCTFTATKIVLSYLTFPFVLLRFWPSIYVYHSLYYYFHILAFLMLMIVPQLKLFMRIPKATDGKKSKSETGEGSTAVKPKIE